MTLLWIVVVLLGSSAYIAEAGSLSAIPKAGQCPVMEGTFGICVEECSSDEGCDDDLKCCSNGCGHTCMKPVSVCAAVLCKKPECKDSYVPEGECCPKCPGLECTYKGITLRDGQKYLDNCNMCTCTNGNVACTEKGCDTPNTGICPAPFRVDVKLNECGQDSDCGKENKCCSMGPGNVCTKPLTDCRVVKCAAPQCDNSFKPADECCGRCECPYGSSQICGGIAALTCDKGTTCRFVSAIPDGAGKCCYDHKPCMQNNMTYMHGQMFDNDCNKCFCAYGQISCTKIECGNQCTYKGMNKAHQEEFRDGCLECKCENGKVSCSNNKCECTEERTGYCGGKGNLVCPENSTCSFKPDIPGAQGICCESDGVWLRSSSVTIFVAFIILLTWQLR